jgi:hypothetical protein
LDDAPQLLHCWRRAGRSSVPLLFIIAVQPNWYSGLSEAPAISYDHNHADLTAREQLPP